VRREYEQATGWYTKALELYRETASVQEIAWASRQLGILAWRSGAIEKAEKLLRESIRLLAPMMERGTLCESQRYLAQLLLEQGRLDEAEKFALAARETVSAEDIVSRATTRVALAQVRAAQGRDEEAETLFAEALEIISDGEHCRILLDIVPPYSEFLRARERSAEAAELDARLAQRVPTAA
jgi:tetratricopeptide (TPR) repeat protein